jgi:hypothetical protein
MKLYYSIWVDCITRLRSIDSNINNWKTKGMISMSIAMTFNFVLIMVLFQREVLGLYFYEINLPSLSDFANFIITMILLYALPCFILNYLMILRRNRFEELLRKYKYHNGKLCLIYFIISFFLPVVLLWLGIFFGK